MTIGNVHRPSRSHPSTDDAQREVVLEELPPAAKQIRPGVRFRTTSNGAIHLHDVPAAATPSGTHAASAPFSEDRARRSSERKFLPRALAGPNRAGRRCATSIEVGIDFHDERAVSGARSRARKRRRLRPRRRGQSQRRRRMHRVASADSLVGALDTITPPEFRRNSLKLLKSGNLIEPSPFRFQMPDVLLSCMSSRAAVRRDTNMSNATSVSVSSQPGSETPPRR